MRDRGGECGESVDRNVLLNWPTESSLCGKSGCSHSSFGGFKQNIKRTMRNRGSKLGRRDINCWAIMDGSLEFEGSTDFGIDTEFRAAIGLGSYPWTF